MTITAHDGGLYEDTAPVYKESSRTWEFGPFKDEEDNNVTPTEVLYTLSDRTGDAYLSLSDVDITGDVDSNCTVDITLNDGDLGLEASETDALTERRIYLEWTYNSNIGTGLKGKFTLVFWIRNPYAEA